jgi:hypothetical protein
MKLAILFTLFAALGMSVQAQTTLSDKLKGIEGKANKITIATEKGETSFEGEDAQKLLKKMKRPEAVTVNVNTDFDLDDLPALHDGPGMKKHVIIIDGDTLSNGFSGKFKPFEHDSAMKKMCKKFRFFMHGDGACMQMPMRGHRMQRPPHCAEEMEDDTELMDEGCAKDGNKVVIIKKENGKTTIETFTGEDAEKKMQEVTKAGKSGKTEKKVIIKKKTDKQNIETQKERNE